MFLLLSLLSLLCPPSSYSMIRLQKGRSCQMAWLNARNVSRVLSSFLEIGPSHSNHNYDFRTCLKQKTERNSTSNDSIVTIIISMVNRIPCLIRASLRLYLTSSVLFFINGVAFFLLLLILLLLLF